MIVRMMMMMMMMMRRRMMMMRRRMMMMTRMMMSGFHNYGDAGSLYRFHLQSGVATPSPHIVIIINVIFRIHHCFHHQHCRSLKGWDPPPRLAPKILCRHFLGDPSLQTMSVLFGTSLIWYPEEWYIIYMSGIYYILVKELSQMFVTWPDVLYRLKRGRTSAW